MPRRDKEGWPFQVGGEINRLSEELSAKNVRIAHRSAWEPPVDLIEESSRLVLKAELAGVRSDSIDLTYTPERNSILLRGTRLEDEDSEENRIGVYQLEIMYGQFEREVALPDVELDADGIRALFRNGLLIVLIPKRG